MGEQSAMSEMSGMSGMSSTSTGQGDSKEGPNKALILIVLCVVIVAVVGAVAALTLGGNTGSPDSTDESDSSDGGDDGGGGSSGGGGGGGGGGVYQKNEPMTTKTEPTTTTKTPVLLLCTITFRVFSKKQYPPDGLCEILFYTNAYYDTSSDKFEGAYDTTSFGLFRNFSRSSTGKMAFGVSFDYQYASAVSGALRKSTAQTKLKELWKDKIYHYGILQAWDNASALKTSNDKLRLMTELKAQTDELKGSVEAELAIGFQFVNGNDLTTLKDVVSYLLTNYPITVLVVISHLFKKKKLDEYNFSNGPSTWNGCHQTQNQRTDCPHLMREIAIQLNTTTIPSDSTVMVSFTMASAFWRLNSTAYPNKKDVALGQHGFWKSRDFTPLEHIQVCVENHSEPVRHEASGIFKYTGSLDNWFLLAFDNAETIQRKMETFFDLVGSLSRRRAWAVYDVDFEDYSNKCNYSSDFNNLRTVSNFLRS